MSQVYAVVDSNGILAALPDREAALAYLGSTILDRDYEREDLLTRCGLRPSSEDYYTAVKNDSLYTRGWDDFLSLVTLTYTNRSK